MSRAAIPQSHAVDKYWLVYNKATSEIQAVYAPTEREAWWALNWLISQCDVNEIPLDTSIEELSLRVMRCK